MSTRPMLTPWLLRGIISSKTEKRGFPFDRDLHRRACGPGLGRRRAVGGLAAGPLSDVPAAGEMDGNARGSRYEAMVLQGL